MSHHPKARGLNKKALPYWDQLCLIFEKSRALGADVVLVQDAASVLQGDISMGDASYVHKFQYLMANLDALDSNTVMEELLNYDFDMHTTNLHPSRHLPT
ncbi:hypothetical protein LINPERPRIM_LOCUS36750 [Linum perenne]